MRHIEFEARTWLHLHLHSRYCHLHQVPPKFYPRQVHLPLTEFAPFFRGQQVEDAPPLDLAKVIISDLIFVTIRVFPRLEHLASRLLVECMTTSSSPALALLRSTPSRSTELSWSTIHFVPLNKCVPKTFTIGLVGDWSCPGSLRILIGFSYLESSCMVGGHYWSFQS